jgi:ankyrin repeat protein
MPAKHINAHAAAEDILSGMTDKSLMEKYQISAQNLELLFHKLVEKGLLKQSELDARVAQDKQALNMVWKCPKCGMPGEKVYDVCPDCGVIVSKFLEEHPKEKEKLGVNGATHDSHGSLPQTPDGHPPGNQDKKEGPQDVNRPEVPVIQPHISDPKIMSQKAGAIPSFETLWREDSTGKPAYKNAGTIGQIPKLAKLAIISLLIAMFFALVTLGKTSLLHWACETGFAPIARLALFLGADEDGRLPDPTETPLLLEAAKRGHTAVAKALLDYGADVDARSKVYYPVDPKTGEPLFFGHSAGTTALMEAVQWGHSKTVRLLVERGADVNARADPPEWAGGTVLMHLTSFLDPDTLQFLIDHGALVNETTRFGDPPLVRVSVYHGRAGIELMKVFLQNGANVPEHLYRALGMAVLSDDEEKVKLLLDYGAPVNDPCIAYPKCPLHHPPLRYVCEKGRVAIARMLLERGAYPDAEVQSTTKTTVLIECSKSGFLEIATLLLDYGANPNAKTTYGSTALIEACKKGHTDIVKLLLNKGVDVNVKTATGTSALTFALRKGNTQVVDLLKSHGAHE